MIDERIKLNEFTYEELIKIIKLENTESLAYYLFKMHSAYNKLIDRIIVLERENKGIKNEKEYFQKKANNRYRAIKDQEKYIAKLHLEAQKYFDMVMEQELENEKE